MVRLIPMTEDQFQAYLQRGVAEYAQEHVKTGNWHPSEALQKSAAQYQQLLPDGLASKNQHLFSIQDESSEAIVGLLWFAVREQGQRPTAFIYDFQIYEQFQRQGYGRQALLALEDKVRELDIDSIALHVFGHNHAAITLYKKAGYEITNLQMAKKISS